MPTLYIVATPIGNLEDITMRALRILAEADFILCEDTRVTQKLLDHYNIRTPMISYHQHSRMRKTEYILDLLAQGNDLALVSDAGTPGISDPGGKLVRAVIDRFGIAERDNVFMESKEEASRSKGAGRVRIESVPGPSAVTAALSISGIPTDRFIFLGFPPHKKGREQFLKKIADSDYPVVVYESKHRIIKFLEELQGMEKKVEQEQLKADEFPEDKYTTFKYLKEQDKKRRKIVFTSVVVCREISKMHETVYRGELKNIIENIKSSPDHQKGEFTVIIGK